MKRKNKENKDDGIIIKLSRKGEEFVYISDSLPRESSKIKIPLETTSSVISNIEDNDDSDMVSYKERKKKEESVKKGEKERKRNLQQQAIVHSVNEEKMDEEEEQEANTIKIMIENTRMPFVQVPSCSSWFDIEKIHEIEMNSLPEFFCGKYPSKTPQNYKEYRNFIISLYRENPKCYLSATGKSFLLFFSLQKTSCR